MLPYCAEGTPLLLKHTSADPFASPDEEPVQDAPTLPKSERPAESAILLAPYDPSQLLDATTPDYFVCLTERNRIRMVTPKDVVDIDTEASLLKSLYTYGMYPPPHMTCILLPKDVVDIDTEASLLKSQYTVEEDTCHDIDTEASSLKSLHTVWPCRCRDNMIGN